MQARYYDPVIGRFYSNDPVGFNPNNIHSFGRYTYGNNNPYRYTDPDGRDAVESINHWAKGFMDVQKSVTSHAKSVRASASKENLDALSEGMQVAGIGAASVGAEPQAGALLTGAAIVDVINIVINSDDATKDGTTKLVTDSVSKLVSSKVKAAATIIGKADSAITSTAEKVVGKYTGDKLKEVIQDTDK
jgi:uncharacterized protein RhaS with RHS repeats